MRWDLTTGGDTALLNRETHHGALAAEADRLLDFFEQPEGVERFAWRRTDGEIDTDRPLSLYGVGRLVHCFSVAQLTGRPRAGQMAEDGVRLLLEKFADPDALGFADQIGFGGGRASDERTAYGHAFALLAGVSGVQAGVPRADELLRRARAAIDTLFWNKDVGAAVETVDRNGAILTTYRGQNANMHLAEAFLAAYELDGERTWLERAAGLARRFVLHTAARYDARVPEHYTDDWRVDTEYGRENLLDPFRPFGTMPGHAVEWARLLLAIAAYLDGADLEHETIAAALFAGALRDGRDEVAAGLAYTVDFDGAVVGDARTHWVVAEALAAAAWLARTTGDGSYLREYDRFWTDITSHFIDRRGGSWWHELDVRNVPAAMTWDGKPDLYHAYQATFAARLTRPSGVALAARNGWITPTSALTESATRRENVR